MDNLNLVALNKAIATLAKEASPLPVGIHEVELTALVKIRGTVKKSQDTWKTPTSSIPLKATLAICLQKAGIQRERIAEILVEAMTEALKVNEFADDYIKDSMRGIDEAMARVDAIVGALPKTKVSGATTSQLICEVEEVRLATEVHGFVRLMA